jgi:phage tail sheath gpL-like
MSTGLEQKWCYGIVGVDSDVSAATSQATTTDAYRLQIACQVAAERPSYEIAAIFGALRARYVDPAESLDWVEMTGLQATYDASQWINRADEELALGGGVTILRSLRTGKVEIVRSVNTKVTSVASGYYDHNPIEISDYMDESLVAAFRRKAAGKKLKSLSVAGTPNTITTTKAKQILHEVMRTLDRLDYIEGVESDIAAGLTAAEISATDRNRLDIGCPFRPIGRAHVIAILKTLTVNAL